MPIIGQISVGDGATFTPSVSSAGELSWTNNKNLPNPEPVDIAQAVVDAGALDSRYLQLSGGTMTGGIVSSTAYMLMGTGTNRQYNIGGSNPIGKGAFLVLNGCDYANNGGAFQLVARDANGNGASLQGSVNGTLSWNGSNVITAAGGTMTGDINYGEKAAQFSKYNNNSTINIVGSSTDSGIGILSKRGSFNNTSLILSSGDQSTNPRFRLSAGDGTTSKELVGEPNGTLTWNSKSIPERAYGLTLVSSSGSNTYTFEIVDNSAVIFAKRGNNCSCHMVDYWTSGSVKIFATATDPITITKTANNGTVTITNVNNSAVGIKILNGGTL